jgi:hypothetical protein
MLDHMPGDENEIEVPTSVLGGNLGPMTPASEPTTPEVTNTSSPAIKPLYNLPSIEELKADPETRKRLRNLRTQKKNAEGRPLLGRIYTTNSED